jgi:Tol biopolymer transport system component
MRKRLLSGIVVAAFLLNSAFAAAQWDPNPKYYPHLPGATLLTGDDCCLALTTLNETHFLPTGKKSAWGEPGDYVDLHGTLSADGSLVAATGLVQGQLEGADTFLFLVYSAKEGTWRQYGYHHCRSTPAISPDNSKLAFAISSSERPHSVFIHFIDIKTGAETEGPPVGSDPMIHLSWSPDGTRIVFDTSKWKPYPVDRWTDNSVEVLDLADGRITKIADGRYPSWSPSGEWIAFLDASEDQRAWLVHPDGSGKKLLTELSWGGDFWGQPVWSPDSRRVLLNQPWNPDKGTVAIHVVDLSTYKRKRLFKDKVEVDGWAPGS